MPEARCVHRRTGRQTRQQELSHTVLPRSGTHRHTCQTDPASDSPPALLLLPASPWPGGLRPPSTRMRRLLSPSWTSISGGSSASVCPGRFCQSEISGTSQSALITHAATSLQPVPPFSPLTGILLARGIFVSNLDFSFPPLALPCCHWRLRVGRTKRRCRGSTDTRHLSLTLPSLPTTMACWPRGVRTRQ